MAKDKQGYKPLKSLRSRVNNWYCSRHAEITSQCSPEKGKISEVWLMKKDKESIVKCDDKWTICIGNYQATPLKFNSLREAIRYARRKPQDIKDVRDYLRMKYMQEYMQSLEKKASNKEA